MRANQTYIYVEVMVPTLPGVCYVVEDYHRVQITHTSFKHWEKQTEGIQIELGW